MEQTRRIAVWFDADSDEEAAVSYTHLELPFGVRTSMSDYRRQEKLINLPLYALSQLWEVCDAFN